MAKTKGMTLMELLIVAIIIGVLAAVALPNLMASSELSKAQAAQNNLLAIAAAEQKYFEDYNSYYTNPGSDSAPTADINTHLHLELSDSFTYSCAAGSPYPTCTAGDGTDTLTLSGVASNGTAKWDITCSPTGSSCTPTY